MKFIQRLGFYLGGFAIGLVLLLFFLNGKEASCDYGPNARTVKNISSKRLIYSEATMMFIQQQDIDSTTVVNLIKYGKVDFKKSNTALDSCKVYHIDNSYKQRHMELKIENCDTIATLLDIQYANIE